MHSVKCILLTINVVTMKEAEKVTSELNPINVVVITTDWAEITDVQPSVFYPTEDSGNGVAEMLNTRSLKMSMGKPFKRTSIAFGDSGTIVSTMSPFIPSLHKVNPTDFDVIKNRVIDRELEAANKAYLSEVGAASSK